MTSVAEVAAVKVKQLADCCLCGLCGGFLRRAATLKECLHTFCRTCVLRHLMQRRGHCPTCQASVDGNILDNVIEDARMQALTDALVPYFERCERKMRTRLECFMGVGTAAPETALYKPGVSGTLEMEPLAKNATNQVMAALKQQPSTVMLHLIPDGGLRTPRLKCPHLIVSGEVPVAVLSAFILSQLDLGPSTIGRVELLLGEECLLGHESLEWVCRNRRLTVGPALRPICLTYRLVAASSNIVLHKI